MIDVYSIGNWVCEGAEWVGEKAYQKLVPAVLRTEIDETAYDENGNLMTRTHENALDLETMALNSEAMKEIPMENGLTMEDNLRAQRYAQELGLNIEDFTDENGLIDMAAFLNAAEKKDSQDPKKYAYVTRGAKLKCPFGSHYRMFNLPNTHGALTMNCPMTIELDSIVGDTQNIRSFGVCKSPQLDFAFRQKVVNLKMVRYNPNDNWKQMPDSGENVRGPECVPLVETLWMDTYSQTKIAKSVEGVDVSLCGLCEKEIKGVNLRNTVITNSCVFCAHGMGIIEIKSSGAEYVDEDQGIKEETAEESSTATLGQSGPTGAR